MSTATETSISYTDDRGVIRLVGNWGEIAAARDTGPSPCGGCGESYPTLVDLFGHECAGSTGVRIPTDVALVPADTPDRTRPQGDGTGAGRKAHRSNQYAGPCAHCGVRVEAEAGRLLRGPNGWQVVHLDGQCDADHDERTAAPAPAEEATADQITLITNLRAERGFNTIQDLAAAMDIRLAPYSGVTKAQAAAMIDWLRERPTVATTRPCRPNKYAGQCRHCGGHVAAEAGFLCKGESGWEVEHNGPCPEAEAPAAAPVPVVPAGHYAIDSTGHNDLAFYRVDHVTEGKWAGATFVKLVVGGHPDRNVRRDAVAGILARIAEAGPQAAAERYGREIGRCGRCNRELTDAESRALGIGPTCRAMAW